MAPPLPPVSRRNDVTGARPRRLGRRAQRWLRCVPFVAHLYAAVEPVITGTIAPVQQCALLWRPSWRSEDVAVTATLPDRCHAPNDSQRLPTDRTRCAHARRSAPSDSRRITRGLRAPNARPSAPSAARRAGDRRSSIEWGLVTESAFGRQMVDDPGFERRIGAAPYLMPIGTPLQRRTLSGRGTRYADPAHVPRPSISSGCVSMRAHPGQFGAAPSLFSRVYERG